MAIETTKNRITVPLDGWYAEITATAKEPITRERFWFITIHQTDGAVVLKHETPLSATEIRWNYGIDPEAEP